MIKINSKINQSVLIIAIFSLVVTMFWVFLGINNALVKSEKPVVSQKEINPISPELDITTLNMLRERK